MSMLEFNKRIKSLKKTKSFTSLGFFEIIVLGSLKKLDF